ncbi:MAG: LL-diaminopimelate aminotransferase [Pseudanabaenaceae cyanobacterium SKYGB_i_bin29]|nr:LL-diaminopimelate aminotransferase [Pseudanabaenaceae cyanobacterium SKYG29]MDW8420498.1 LL-diaminopimelate aminotransferase [Pseudanabaenaceae cyanobacterium SKYGB_i_bin29]
MAKLFADRLAFLGGNVFATIDQVKQERLRQGKPLIDLSLGSADLPTHPVILAAIAAALQDTSTHGYVLFGQTKYFREAVAQWFEQRFGIQVDPETEVLPLIGSQEGTAHLPLALLNPGDYALVLDPGYPSHYGGVYLAGGVPWGMPLRSEFNFLPDLGAIPPSVLQQAKLMILSYPHNPTTAIADMDFFRSAVEFCQRYGLWLIHDFPYMDIVFDGYVAPAMLQADPDKSVTIEFFTLSKSYNMGGFRVGFAIGNSQLISALRQIKAVVDFNQYQGILRGAITALTSDEIVVKQSVLELQKRRDFMVDALQRIGWQVQKPKATMYLWAKIPHANSMEFCRQLIWEQGIALSPGAGFGKQGEGFVRFALVHPIETLQEVIDRLPVFSLY